MIVITMEIWPGGDPVQRRPLGTCLIVNDGKSVDPTRGSYNYVLTGKVDTRKRRGRVEDFPRVRKDAWCLLSQVLGVAGKR